MFYHPNMLSGMHADYDVAAAKHNGQPSFQPLESANAASAAVHKTLIPVDGSESAGRAIEHAIDLAQRGWTSEIHLLNVQPLAMREEFTLNKAVRAEHQARTAAGRQVLKRARTVLRDSGLDSKTTIGFGPTVAMIVRYASENAIDAIVMGTRGKRTLSGLFSRSVATRVARRVDSPVTIVRRVGEPGAGLERTTNEMAQPATAD
jgi:nucleotide-binding universal stress UspA family protein